MDSTSSVHQGSPLHHHKLTDVRTLIVEWSGDSLNPQTHEPPKRHDNASSIAGSEDHCQHHLHLISGTG